MPFVVMLLTGAPLFTYWDVVERPVCRVECGGCFSLSELGNVT